MARKKKSNGKAKKKLIGWDQGYVLYKKNNGSFNPYPIHPSKLIAMLDGNRGEYEIVKTQSKEVLSHAQGNLKNLLAKLNYINIS